MHSCLWLILCNKFLISADEVTATEYSSFRSSQWEMKSWTHWVSEWVSVGNEAGALSTSMKSTPDIQRSIFHLVKVPISKKDCLGIQSVKKGGRCIQYMKKHSLKPKAMNHYLKPFQPAVFFFNCALPPPTSWPRSLRNSLKEHCSPCQLTWHISFYLEPSGCLAGGVNKRC